MVIRWSMREVTADLQREGTAQPFRTVGAVDALRAGAAELSAAGFEVERSSQADVLLAGLPPEVDLVVSRIVAVIRMNEIAPPKGQLFCCANWP